MANKTKLKKLATVNIIELKQGVLHSIRSFNDTVEGNKQAEKVFASLIRDRNDPEGTTGEKVTDEDIECFLDNGIYDEQEGYEVMISHSDTAPESI